MDLSSSSNTCFHFVCTNYGSNKDGIGHYTYKVVNELKKNNSLEILVYSKITYNLSKLELLFSLKMTFELLKLKRALKKNSKKNYIILEYPFVEYNPIFLIALFLIKRIKNSSSKIVVSLHEYQRTKLFRKVFIRLLIQLSDIILFTKSEDVENFMNQRINFRSRNIPANIEPSSNKKVKSSKTINVSFFGIINLETKEIHNMLKGWSLYLKKEKENRIKFHFITSSYNEQVKNNMDLEYHFNLNDVKVSNLVHEMHFMILPLKPKISINNGSFSVGCIHRCIPVGVFDERFFSEAFGLRMKNYSKEEFERIFKIINHLNFEQMKEKSNLAYEYGKVKSVRKTAESYFDLTIS
mgnify:CR=1 FL=1